MMNNLTKIWLISGVLIMFCSGCEQIKDDRLKNGLIYCSEGNPENFNPQTTTSRITLDASAHQIYDTLLEKTASSDQLAPSLAENWQVSDDGKTIDMFLRKGVKFHHTRYFMPSREFNADDVLFSFNRWRLTSNPFYASADSYPHMQSYQLELLIDDIEKVSDYHIRFKLSHRDDNFLPQLATDYMVILSAEYAAILDLHNAHSQLDNYPIGTGPFFLEDFVKDEYIRYKAHPDYWQGKAKITHLVFDITPQSSNRLAKLITGECDVVAHPVASEMEILQDKPGITLQSKSADNVAFWAFNTLKPPFNRAEVRRALAKALDRKTMYKAIYYGMAFPANSLLPPSSWAYNPNSAEIHYDPEQAKKELRAAGIEEGFTMQIWSAQIERDYNPNSLKMAELIKANLAKVGIKVEIVEFEWATLRKKLAEYAHDSVLIGWTPDMPTPDNYFIPTLSCASAVIGSNRAAWCNPYFDNLMVNATTSDFSQRKKSLIQAQELLQQEMPVVPLAHSLSFLAKRDNVINIKFQPYSAISFKHAEKF